MMRIILISLLMLAFAPANILLGDTPEPLVRFGVVTDVHYADKPPMDAGPKHPAGKVFYRESLAKMEKAVAAFNERKPDFVIELGDLKDFTRNRAESLAHLDRIEAAFAKFEGPRYHVLGNHDMDCLTKEMFFARTPNDGKVATCGHYAFVRGGVTFVVLDACYNHKFEPYEGDERGVQNWEWYDAWVPPVELKWLEATLAVAKGPAVVFCHQRLDPLAAGEGTEKHDHAVKNAAVVRAVLEKSGKVRSVLTGHEHRGGFCRLNGIAYHSLYAMAIGGPASATNSFYEIAVYPSGELSVTRFTTPARAAGENPLGFPETTRTLVAEFSSADEARAAELSVAPLYGNAPMAFSVRWDDTNARHPKKAEMMNRAGVKGTFYLVNWLHDHPAFIAEELKRRGHDVGNHTLFHPHLPQVSPNRVFREVVLNRMVVETNSQQTVTAYVAPFSWGDPKKTPAERIALIRRIVSESGHFVTCDRSWPQLPEGAPDYPVYPARWFMSDDRNPKADLFRREFSNAVAEVSAAGRPGRVAFSMHAWCDDAGDAIQESCLKEVRAAHPEYWYAADNDYGAYCYQRDYVRFRKLKADGARATWEVVGFSAAQLGSEMPLSLAFGRTPKGVRCDGAELVANRGTWELPPAGKRAVRIGSVGPDGTHAAFPGLAVRLSLDSDGQVATVEIANGGKTALEGGWAVLFASPEHPDAGRIVLDVGELASGASFVRRVDLGRRVPALLTADERPLAVLQYDFATAEGSARLWTTSVVATAAGGLPESLWTAPPAEARPRVWWHWVNGNVSKDGIVRDLDALADAGIGGVTVFDAGLRIPKGPLAFNTPAWDDHVLFAIREAKKRGLAVTLASCSGWSSSGGPWVAPKDAMKFVETAETVVTGGTRVTLDLPRPPAPHGFYEDIAVLAFPRPASERQDMLEEDFTLTSSCTNDAAVLRRIADGRDEPVFRPRRFEGAAHSFTFAFKRPYRASSLYVKLQDGGWWRDRCPFTIEVSDDGAAWRQVAAFDVVTCEGGQLEWSAKRVPFPETTARQWRVTMQPDASDDPNGMYTLAELRLDRRVSLSGLPAKTSRVAVVAPRDDFATASDQVVVRDGIRDLTRFVKDGRLDWEAPAGEWTVLRVGMAANGECNRPATDAGRGPEVDKLSPAAVRRHFDAYVGRLAKRCDVDGKAGLTGLLVDSYESGSQNWTQGFETTLRERLGYDFLPYLVLFSGRIVDSVADSERRLKDFRRVVAARFAEAYAGTLQACCHEAGLSFELEPYGNMPSAIAEYGAFADIPMTEFWSSLSPLVKHPYESFAKRVTPKVVAVARAKGRPIVQAEAFTAANVGYSQTPFTLKAIGDRHFALGVNRLVIHRFVHQPWDDTKLPGMTMAEFGTNFDRTQTWWPFVKPYVAYLTRAQALLQAGEWVADGGEGRLAWIDRRYGDGTYGRFVALDTPTNETRVVRLPVTGRPIELWDAETGEIMSVRGRETDGATEVSVAFKPSGSVFVMARPAGSAAAASDRMAAAKGLAARPKSQPITDATLHIAGKTLRGFPDWSKVEDDDIRFFSGVATYEIDVPTAGELDLGEVHELAEVSAGGRVIATLWRPPYRCRVPAGRLTVRVANLWANRLIGDERHPEKRATFVTWKFYQATDVLKPSGILGPVRLFEKEY